MEKIKNAIAARENELESIKKQFDRVLEGQGAICVISGPPGIGKTFLAQKALKDLKAGNVTYVYGKFRQYDNQPLIAVAEVMDQAAKHILTLPFNELEHMKNELMKALGSDADMIVSISSYTSKLFETNNRANRYDHKKQKYRLKRAIIQFLSVISESLFPLVIFIDDLQWADLLSLEIIEAIMKEHELLNLLLMLACRDREEKNREKEKSLTLIFSFIDERNHIKLQPLTGPDLEEYLKLIFGSGMTNIDYLVRILYGLTMGNPFYIKEILDIFIKENILVYSVKTKIWTARMTDIKKLNLPEDIELIIEARLNKVENDVKPILEFISCLDGQAEYELLRKITGLEDEILSNRLQKLCAAGFLVTFPEETPQGDSLCYSFVHDIIWKHVYQSISPERKSEIHYKIVEKLLDQEDHLWTKHRRLLLAYQMLRTGPNQLKKENPAAWIYELYCAGLDVKQTAAFEQALKLFDYCLELLPYCSLEKKHELEMHIHLRRGECQYLCELYEEAEVSFKALIRKSRTTENLIDIKKTYMNLYLYSGNLEKAIELGVELLRDLKFNLNAKYLRMELMKGKPLFSENRIKKLESAPLIEDKRLLHILEILTKMGPAANMIDDDLFQLILLKIGSISSRYGNSPYSPIGYIAYSFIFHHLWRCPEKGIELERIALELLEVTDNSYTKPIVYFLTGSLIHHWTNSMEDAVVYLEKSIEEGVRLGEFLFGGYSITSIINTKYMMGIPLDEISRYICRQEEALPRMGHDTVRFIYNTFKGHIDYLQSGTSPVQYYEMKEELNSFSNTKSLTYYALMLQRLFMERRIKEAYQLVQDIDTFISLLKGFIIYADLLFYSTLTRLSAHPDLPESEKIRNKRQIKRSMKELEYWVNLYKDNHYARSLLMKAEYEALFFREKPLERIYNEAINHAREKGCLPLEALGNYLAAKYCNYNIKLAKFYACEAAALYKEWGAVSTAEFIIKEFGLENNLPRQEEKTRLQTEKDVSGEEINQSIIYHLGRVEKMEEEEGFRYLLDFIAEISQADYVAYLSEKSDEMHLQYEKRRNEKVKVYEELKNIKYIGSMSHKVIRYTANAGEEVLLNPKADRGIFAKDLYILNKDEISILCIPIKYLGVSLGLAYLEKAGGDGFHKDIAQMIRSMTPVLFSKRMIINDTDTHSIANTPEVVSPLTTRELEVLELLAVGMSNSAISKKLNITLGTVKIHLSNIYGKLEVNSRIKAVVKAKEMNIIKI